ncbi:MAG: hypothetical protein F4201_01365 [Nitrospira sp. SB0677_bin_15]|nr:hypothetical protein [Nitrospira sp. SB0667_bin_9]MYD31938.1 hypothetical protein [Nitrospira sp. SB0661_bin_20]MYG39469.1 hypothetical protein [Nitrospira sp. SB0677_bin_15]MYH01826.1 hypothetical protein [Nitrospira sp. SB0675_bin_23]MYJ22136.1 hypothetical protein [Nitrospira sp. SB0673_bin_12]
MPAKAALALASATSEAAPFRQQISDNKSSNTKENTMNPLDSIPGTIGAGFVLTVVLYFVVKMLV